MESGGYQADRELARVFRLLRIVKCAMLRLYIPNADVQNHRQNLSELLGNLRQLLNHQPDLQSRRIIADTQDIINVVKGHYFPYANSYPLIELVDKLAMDLSSKVYSYLSLKNVEEVSLLMDEILNEEESREAFGSHGMKAKNNDTAPTKSDANEKVTDQRQGGIEDYIADGGSDDEPFENVKGACGEDASITTEEIECTRSLDNLAQVLRPFSNGRDLTNFESAFYSARDVSTRADGESMGRSSEVGQPVTSHSPIDAPIQNLTSRRIENDKARKKIKEEWNKLQDKLKQETSDSNEDFKLKKKQEGEKDDCRKSEKSPSKVLVVAPHKTIDDQKQMLRDTRCVNNNYEENLKTASFFRRHQENRSSSFDQWKVMQETESKYEQEYAHASFVNRMAFLHEAEKLSNFGPNDRKGRRSAGSLKSADGDAKGDDFKKTPANTRSHPLGAVPKQKNFRRLATDSDSSRSRDTSPASLHNFRNRLPRGDSGNGECRAFTKQSGSSSFHKKSCQASQCSQLSEQETIRRLQRLYRPRPEPDARPSADVPRPIFGISLRAAARQTGFPVPNIIIRCTVELENRGLLTWGLYRISAVKSHVERFCVEIERVGEALDISQTPPHVLSNAIKNFFRMMTEPLLPPCTYDDLVKIARVSRFPRFPLRIIITHLKMILASLPPLNLRALGMLMLHLKLVEREKPINYMTSVNLAVIFTPTLIRWPEGSDPYRLLQASIQKSFKCSSLKSKSDKSSKDEECQEENETISDECRAVQLLIDYSPWIFDLDPPEQESSAPRLQRAQRRHFQHQNDAWLNAAGPSGESCSQKAKRLSNNTPSSSPGISEASLGAGDGSSDEEEISKETEMKGGVSEIRQPTTGHTSVSALTAERRRLFFESSPTSHPDIAPLSSPKGNEAETPKRDESQESDGFPLQIDVLIQKKETGKGDPKNDEKGNVKGGEEDDKKDIETKDKKDIAKGDLEE